MSASSPGNGQYGGVLAGVKAKPSMWPTASLDTGCGHHPRQLPGAAANNFTTRSLQLKSPRNQGRPAPQTPSHPVRIPSAGYIPDYGDDPPPF
jgi:hypothetical protein